MPDFTIEHLAATLAVTRKRERQRCITILEQLREEASGGKLRAVAVMSMEAVLDEAIKRLTATESSRLETGPLTPEEPGVPDEEVTHTADGLPPDVHLDDFVEGTHLARRHGTF